MRFFTVANLVFLSGFCLQSALADARTERDSCVSETAPRSVAKSSSGRTLLWSFTSVFPQDAPFRLSSGAEKDHARWVTAHTRWSARENIRNGIRIRRDALQGLDARDSYRLTLERDIRNLARVERSEIGKIRPLRCLEGIAFREFLKVADLRGSPQEFQAVFMEKNGEIRMLGDFYRKSPGGVVGTQASAATIRERERLRREGWTYHAHLHNHPFDFRNPYGDVGGTLVPSDADISLYRHERPLYAWITNGLEMIEIPRKDFSRFENAR